MALPSFLSQTPALVLRASEENDCPHCPKPPTHSHQHRPTFLLLCHRSFQATDCVSKSKMTLNVSPKHILRIQARESSPVATNFTGRKTLPKTFLEGKEAPGAEDKFRAAGPQCLAAHSLQDGGVSLKHGAGRSGLTEHIPQPRQSP